MFELGIGYLGLMPDEFGRLSMRQLMWRFENMATNKEDQWDYVRTIIAGYVGKPPKQIMKLPRDRIIVTDEMRESAKEFLLKMRGSN